MNKIKLSDIKVKLPFNIQKGMYIGHLMDWKDGIHKYDIRLILMFIFHLKELIFNVNFVGH